MPWETQNFAFEGKGRRVCFQTRGNALGIVLRMLRLCFRDTEDMLRRLSLRDRDYASEVEVCFRDSEVVLSEVGLCFRNTEHMLRRLSLRDRGYGSEVEVCFRDEEVVLSEAGLCFQDKEDFCF